MTELLGSETFVDRDVLRFALGLFAVVGILRYRTEEIRIRDAAEIIVFHRRSGSH